MTDSKEDYRRWVFEGGCPCCFPYWDYPDLSVQSVWDWQDEFQAWDVYAEIQGEEEDD